MRSQLTVFVLMYKRALFELFLETYIFTTYIRI